MTGPRVVVDGLLFPEGPRWHADRLFCSDIFTTNVLSVTAGGDVAVVCSVPGYPSGLGWSVDGALLIASVIDKRLLRREADGSLVTIADLSALTRWTINDMVVDGRGRAYIGDVGFELGRDAPRPGQIVLVDVDGAARVVDDQVMFPNGSVVTPDGRTLIVGETFAGCLTAFDIADDGSLSNRRVWARLPEGAVPDGSCLDADGAVWTASPTTRECIRLGEGGVVLQRVSTGDRGAYACMLGGADRRTLFICTALTFDPETAIAQRAGRIESLEVDVPGAGWP
jgi:sugar lactone lactonase YvrE